MRLWHKIFMIVLVFVTVSIEATGIFVSQSSFRGMVETEVKNAQAAQNTFASGIVNRTMYERIRTGEILLSKEELADIIREISRDAGTGYGQIVVTGANGEVVYPTATDISDEILSMHVESGNCKSIITDSGDSTLLVTVSCAELERLDYRLFTIRDITDSYTAHDKQMMTIWIISMALALIAAILISCAISVTLRPLKVVNNGLEQIKNGDYAFRLNEKGSPEFRQLSKNVNTMAKSVQENVERIEGIAASRKRFVDSFAHEMKTPLTSIIGFADILRSRRVVSDQQRLDYSSIIIEEASRMKSLSGKLLEMATTDSTNLDLEDVYVPELLGEVYNSTLPLLAKKNMRLRMASKKVYINADKELFKSLLYNLIDNAVKASEENGEIRMVCAEENGRALISVTDDGVGMAREDLIRVTEPFYMVDKSRSRKAGGAGLGLSLCAEICKRHNALFTIDSILGEGTMVTINIRCFDTVERREEDEFEFESGEPDEEIQETGDSRGSDSDNTGSGGTAATERGSEKAEEISEEAEEIELLDEEDFEFEDEDF
ncbi:MAG: HAMP domain-containing sensor histidine kinase [Clostridia bacterium]|nr:HAMP domain-containing sensor histidine kinase [Clostridia bacterium]